MSKKNVKVQKGDDIEKPHESVKEGVVRSIRFSKEADEVISDVANQNKYRGNRSMAVDSLTRNSREYKEFSKKRKTK